MDFCSNKLPRKSNLNVFCPGQASFTCKRQDELMSRSLRSENLTLSGLKSDFTDPAMQVVGQLTTRAWFVGLGLGSFSLKCFEMKKEEKLSEAY